MEIERWRKERRFLCVSRPRQYASWIQGYAGGILQVGISRDKKDRERACAIEPWRIN